MKKQNRSLWLLAILALSFGVVTSGTRLAAQRSASPGQQQQPAQQQPPPDQPSQAAPDSQAQSDSGTVFSGTIVKAGDKYMLQDSGGKSYDIDRQDLAKAHEGKQVRVKGTLDQDGKTIHVK